MKNKFMRFLLSACAGISALVASAVVQVDIEHDTSGVRLGYWTSDFAAAKAYADENHVPFLGFWGSAGCGYCALMKSTGLISKEFTAWVEKNKIVMCYVEVPASQTSVMTPAKEFIKGSNKSGLYPFMTFYWNKADGSQVKADFTGRKGDIPPYSKGTLGTQFVAGLNYYFGTYKPVDAYAGGYFAVTNLPNARLEAVVGKTAKVDIPLFRTATGVATNRLQVGSAAQVAVVWGASEKTKTYTHTLTAAEKAKTGAIALRLYTADGKTVKSTSAINVVAEPAVSVKNPKWVGESFDYGEWTMDYEAAKKKDGVVLVNFSGVLWCPYCAGVEKTLLASAKFKEWAARNRVSLVLFDQSRASSPATAAGNGTARLLSYAEGNSSPLGGPASGAAYLSRKSISASAAASRIALTTRYTKQWLGADSTAARLGNPTFLIVKDDKVVTRVNLFNASSVDGYDVDENIARLNEALLLAGHDEKNDFRTTTAQTLAPGETKRATFQINDTAEWFKLSGLKAGAWKFDATDKNVTVSIYSSTNEVASGAGTVTATLTAAQAAAACTVKLSAYTSATTKYATAAANGTTFTAGISFKNVPIPGTLQFATTSASRLESDGTGTISVTRTGGVNGAASATVSVSKGSNGTGRVTVSPTTLTWADGNAATKTVTYRIAQTSAIEADETFTITLAAGAGSAAPVGAKKTFTLTVTDVDEPVFAQKSYAVRAYKGMDFSASYPLQNIRENKSVTFAQTGRLPTGLKFTYNSSARAMVLSGKTTRAGTYTVSVAVTEKRTDKTATGAAATFTVTVVDPKKLTAGEAGYNPVIAAGRTVYGSIPVYGKLGGKSVLAGVATLKAYASGRVSLSYKGTDGARGTYSGALALDSAGTATMNSSRGGVTAALKIDSKGRATFTLDGLSSRFGTSLASEASGYRLFNSTYGAYAGYYTVTLPANAADLTAGKETIPTGTGYVILKMNTATFTRTGKVNYAGLLANGTTFSGSAYLSGTMMSSGGVEWAYLPISVAKTGGVGVGAVLRIRKNAAATYGSDPQVVLAASSSVPLLLYGADYTSLNVYGGIYDRTLDFSKCCEDYYETTKFNVRAETGWFAPSALYGAIKTLPAATVQVGANDRLIVTNADSTHTAALKLTKSSGIVSGSLNVTFANGRKVRMAVKGVVLVGWVDCGCSEDVSLEIERPVFSGAATYADRINGKASKRGFAVELKP